MNGERSACRGSYMPGAEGSLNSSIPDIFTAIRFQLSDEQCGPVRSVG